MDVIGADDHVLGIRLHADAVAVIPRAPEVADAVALDEHVLGLLGDVDARALGAILERAGTQDAVVCPRTAPEGREGLVPRRVEGDALDAPVRTAHVQQRRAAARAALEDGLRAWRGHEREVTAGGATPLIESQPRGIRPRVGGNGPA